MTSAFLGLLLVLAFFGPNQINVGGRELPSTPLTKAGLGDSCIRFRPWVPPQPPNTPGGGGGGGGFPDWKWPPFNMQPLWPQPPNTPVSPRGGGGGGFPDLNWPPFNIPPFWPQPSGPSGGGDGGGGGGFPGWGFPPVGPVPPTGGSGCMGECNDTDMTCPAKCYRSNGCTYDCNQCTVSCK